MSAAANRRVYARVLIVHAALVRGEMAPDYLKLLDEFDWDAAAE